jgi:hypothetical protein
MYNQPLLFGMIIYLLSTVGQGDREKDKGSDGKANQNPSNGIPIPYLCLAEVLDKNSATASAYIRLSSFSKLLFPILDLHNPTKDPFLLFFF